MIVHPAGAAEAIAGFVEENKLPGRNENAK
jgi:hypothetical protein